MRRLSWIVFDLDETLYPRSVGLMAEISARITQYMVERLGVHPQHANHLRQRFRGTYGTALRGLMEERYAVDPEDYFRFVHDINLDGRIEADPALRAMLLDIPLRRAVLTNSNIEHAERVLRRMQVRDCFEQVIDIKALDFHNKPTPESFQRALQLLGAHPTEVIFVEDTPANTRVARTMGMLTVLVDCPDSDAADYHVSSVLEVGRLVRAYLEAGGA